MLLTITTTHQPATDLGYLLRKNPARVQTFALSFGQAHVFYPEANASRCTAALLLDIDPIGLLRGRRDSYQSVDHYVNDRPYVASSFLSVALGQVFGTALAGRSRERPELAATPLPLVARLAVLPCRGGEDLPRRLFEPLGYQLTMARHPLDPAFPDWGDSPYYTVELQAWVRLADLLNHLSVLIPVLDDDKHYWVGDDEVEKLLRRGAGWLAAHPERDTIARRYLRHSHRLTRAALARLAEEDVPDLESAIEEHDSEEAAIEAPIRLHDQRLAAVADALRRHGVRRVLDLGCGEGRLIAVLMRDPAFTEILGLDVSVRSLENAARRLRLGQRPASAQGRVRLIQGALTYRDDRLAGYDGAAVVEVIEHLDPSRLATFERVLFESARPRVVVLTTPNAEYNVKFPSLPGGMFRHRDHRFEWTRQEAAAWAERVEQRFGYRASISSVGPEDPSVGAPSHLLLFSLNDRPDNEEESA